MMIFHLFKSSLKIIRSSLHLKSTLLLHSLCWGSPLPLAPAVTPAPFLCADPHIPQAPLRVCRLPPPPETAECSTWRLSLHVTALCKAPILRGASSSLNNQHWAVLHWWSPSACQRGSNLGTEWGLEDARETSLPAFAVVFPPWPSWPREGIRSGAP